MGWWKNLLLKKYLEKMMILEFLNNFHFTVLFQNKIFLFILHYFSIFLVNLISYFYVFIKGYKVLCYSKMTFEWLPMINPYRWPFLLIERLTQPYFNFWSKLFPSVRLQNSSLEISGIVALEALNSVLYLSVRCTQTLLSILEETEKTISTHF